MDDEGLTREEWLVEVYDNIMPSPPPEDAFTAMEMAEATGEDAELLRKRLNSMARRGEIERIKIGVRVWYREIKPKNATK